MFLLPHLFQPLDSHDDVVHVRFPVDLAEFSGKIALVLRNLCGGSGDEVNPDESVHARCILLERFRQFLDQLHHRLHISQVGDEMEVHRIQLAGDINSGLVYGHP